MKRLKILILMRPFWTYPKHRPKVDMIKALEKYADVYYWYHNGHIQTILQSLNVKPDFIFHYDIAWGFSMAPNITGLAQTDILTGCFVIDLHWKPEDRKRYFEQNKIDLIFSATKRPFLRVFPQYKYQFHWLPWGINPLIMKDWKLPKSIDTLLMGLVHIHPNHLGKHKLPNKIPPRGRYAFRDAVFQQMKDDPTFTFHPHPGDRALRNPHLIVNKRYGKTLNRSKIFYTCGSRDKNGGVSVLKFFESLACKTLLLAEPNEDIKELGFVDQKNYIACDVHNVVEKTNFYLKNEQLRKQITLNGYNFIHQHHTNDHRAKFLINEIKAKL